MYLVMRLNIPDLAVLWDTCRRWSDITFSLASCSSCMNSCTTSSNPRSLVYARIPARAVTHSWKLCGKSLYSSDTVIVPVIERTPKAVQLSVMVFEHIRYFPRTMLGLSLQAQSIRLLGTCILPSGSGYNVVSYLLNHHPSPWAARLSSSIA